MRRLPLALAVSFLAVIAVPPRGHAQLEGGGAPPPSEALVPPSVLEPAEATYPADALANGVSAAVDLVIVAMVLWAASGLWMWWEMRATRWWGIAAAASGIAIFVLLVLAV